MKVKAKELLKVRCGGCNGWLTEGESVIQYKGKFYCGEDCLRFDLMQDVWTRLTASMIQKGVE